MCLYMAGWLDKSDFLFQERHPMILPKPHPYTKRIIDDIHRKKQHSSAVITLAAIRETCWINGSLSTVKHYLCICAICICRRARPMTQMMSNLPPGHLAVNQPSFTLLGVDIYGPFTISQGRCRNATTNVCGVILVCLSTRAVYLNVAASPSITHCLNVIE